MEILSKTILSVYKYLGAISNAIDNLVLKKSINSGFYNNGRYTTAYEAADEIVELTERKVNLINIKVLTEDCLMELEPLTRKVLTLLYVDNVKRDGICEVLNISTRTFFRKQKEGIKAFEKRLICKGYTKEKILTLFNKEKWLINLYKKNGGVIEKDIPLYYANTSDFRFINGIVKGYVFV